MGRNQGIIMNYYHNDARWKDCKKYRDTKEENILYQCPYNKACKCNLQDPCYGCVDWAKSLNNEDK